ncbi:MAG: UMP kinase [Puniceicoccales bacterium]|jgi:uridylate kinase|nr:UMP kinase [Puniceicoccales bacterium]
MSTNLHSKETANELRLRYRRIVLKLSGEALRNNETGEAIDTEGLGKLAEELAEVRSLGVQIALVVGGGNIFRGLSGETKNGTDRTTGDNMGMLATMINGLAIMDCFEKHNMPVRVLTAIPMNKVAEPFIQRRALRHLEKGRVVILVAGTGNPYCTTDYAAALRANELHADAIFKATKVDGIYTKDPMKYADAVRYETVSHEEAVTKRLGVMDTEAFSLCQRHKMPILVFSMNTRDGIRRAVLGEKIGTLVG